MQQKNDVVERKPGDAAEVEWRIDVDVVEDAGAFDFKGPFAQGKKGDRFLYLAWGDVAPTGAFHMFRRAKLMLSAVDVKTVRSALATGTLTGSLAMTLPNGTPVCAAVRPPQIAWIA